MAHGIRSVDTQSGIEAVCKSLLPDSGQVKVLVLNSDSKLGHWFSGILNQDERAQCQSYRKPIDQLCIATMRGLWKIGAAALTSTHPNEIHDRRSPFGRPILLDRNGRVFDPKFDLNVSRTGSWCGIVISGAGRCGIDIEQIDPGVINSDLIELLANIWTGIDSSCNEFEQKSQRFFERWTQLEAVLKADGCGLSGGFEGIQAVPSGTDQGVCLQLNSKTWMTRPIRTPSCVVGTCTFDDEHGSLVEIDVSEFEQQCMSAFSARVNTV